MKRIASLSLITLLMACMASFMLYFPSTTNAQSVAYAYQAVNRFVGVSGNYCGQAASCNIIGSGAAFHQLTWNVSGTLATCTITVDSSSDNVSWSTGGVITVQTCTANPGAPILSASVVPNYVRMTITETGTGTLSPSLTGFINAPAGGGGPPTGAASGDLGGSYPGPSVTKINGTTLSGLGTGIVKNTTGTGIPSIAVAGDFPTLNQNTTGTAATAAPTGAASGDLGGTYPGPSLNTVVATKGGLGQSNTFTQGAPLTADSTTLGSSSAAYLDAAKFAGADIAIKINAAGAALSGTQGAVDARAITTNLTTSTTLVCGASQMLYLPLGLTITSSANPAITVASGCQIFWPKGKLQVTTSGATGIAAASTVATVPNVILDGFNITASNSDTGIGFDITAISSGLFRAMSIVNFHTDIGNSGSCNAISCYYNKFERIGLTCAAAVGHAIHLNLSANEQNFESVDIHGCLNGTLIGGGTSGVMITNQVTNGVHLKGVSVEGQQNTAVPGAIVGASCTAGAATLFYAATWKTEGGETHASAEQTIASCTDGTLVLPAPPSAPASAVGWVPYVGVATGKLTRQQTQTACASTVQFDSQAATDLQCAPTATWTEQVATTITGYPAPSRNQAGAALNCVYCSSVDWAQGRAELASQTPNVNLVAKTFRAATAISGPIIIVGVGQSNVSPQPIADNAGTITIIPGSSNQRNTNTYGYNPLASNNLLSNASFENWTDVNNPLKWQAMNGTNIDTATCTAPTTCMLQTSTAGTFNQGSFGVAAGDTTSSPVNKGIVTTDSVAAKLGTTYTLVYDVSAPADATTAQYRPGIIFYDSTGTKITGQSTNFENNITSQSGLWTVGGAFDSGSTTGFNYTSGCQCWTTSAITLGANGTLERRYHTFSLPINGKFGTQTIARFRLALFRSNAPTTAANGVIYIDDIGLYEGPANIEWGAIDGMATGLAPKQVGPIRDSSPASGSLTGFYPNPNVPQMMLGGWTSATPVGTLFASPSYRSSLNTAVNAATITTKAITVTGISTSVSVAEGAAATLAFTLDTCNTFACAAQTTTAVTCTIGNNGTACAQTGQAVAIPANSLIVVQAIQTGTGSAQVGSISLTYQ